MFVSPLPRCDLDLGVQRLGSRGIYEGWFFLILHLAEQSRVPAPSTIPLKAMLPHFPSTFPLVVSVVAADRLVSDIGPAKVRL